MTETTRLDRGRAMDCYCGSCAFAVWRMVEIDGNGNPREGARKTGSCNWLSRRGPEIPVYPCFIEREITRLSYDTEIQSNSREFCQAWEPAAATAKKEGK